MKWRREIFKEIMAKSEEHQAMGMQNWVNASNRKTTPSTSQSNYWEPEAKKEILKAVVGRRDANFIKEKSDTNCDCFLMRKSRGNERITLKYSMKVKR